MVTQRKHQTGPTTLYTDWGLKDELNLYRIPVERYKNRKVGTDYESDHQLLTRIFKVFKLAVDLDTTNPLDRDNIIKQITELTNKPNNKPLHTFNN